MGYDENAKKMLSTIELTPPKAVVSFLFQMSKIKSDQFYIKVLKRNAFN